MSEQTPRGCTVPKGPVYMDHRVENIVESAFGQSADMKAPGEKGGENRNDK